MLSKDVPYLCPGSGASGIRPLLANPAKFLTGFPDLVHFSIAAVHADYLQLK